MTYYNGNPYAGPTESAPLDKWAHDACLPDALFTVHTFANGDTLRQQVWPWHWSPVWGAAKPCAWCGQPVEELTGRGMWQATAPGEYVVTFDPRPVTGPGALDGLQRMTLADARALAADAALIPKTGRVVNARTLETVAR